MANSESKTQPGLGPVGDGAFGSTTVNANKKTPKAKPIRNVETVAIHSMRNLHWDGVGSLSIGYNIVTEAQAEKWLTNKHTRLATPEEVAGAYRN